MLSHTIMSKLRICIIAAMITVAFPIQAFGIDSLSAVKSDVSSVDSLLISADTIPTKCESRKKNNFFTSILNYFNESNKPKTYKKFDFSIIGGPHYSSDTKFGVGLVAAGFYRHNLRDSITTPSNISLYGDISTVGFYLLGIRGNHIFPFDRNRIDYNLYFYSFPRKFWGIGFEQGNNMANASKFNEIFIRASANYLHRLASNIYFGPGIEYSYAHAAKEERPELWNGLASHTSTLGIGLKLQYDTRDNLTATQNGILASVEQRFNPKFMGNRYAFSYTSLRLCYFHNLWRGSVFAAQAQGTFNYGRVPWAMMATFGGSSVMRGYYEGRFRDKCEMDLTLELRQHVWRRNGIVVWGGVGTVFSKMSQIMFKRLLPNAGIGYRWEFKQRTNVRIDYGFAKGETAFIFSINEAF